MTALEIEEAQGWLHAIRDLTLPAPEREEAAIELALFMHSNCQALLRIAYVAVVANLTIEGA